MNKLIEMMEALLDSKNDDFWKSISFEPKKITTEPNGDIRVKTNGNKGKVFVDGIEYTPVQPKPSKSTCAKGCECKESKVVCGVCKDTHTMYLGGRAVPCACCPLPCQLTTCRSTSTQAYCDKTPCGCDCHKPDLKPDPQWARNDQGLYPLEIQMLKELDKLLNKDYEAYNDYSTAYLAFYNYYKEYFLEKTGKVYGILCKMFTTEPKMNKDLSDRFNTHAKNAHRKAFWKYAFAPLLESVPVGK